MSALAGRVDGLVEPGFGAVADAFAANFDDAGEVGAACCVYVDGRPMVDLWGGDADPTTGRPWARDTLQLVFSTTKGATATCVNLAAEAGLLDIDARVADLWPEFGHAGKDAIPVRWLLAHQAGLPIVDTPLTLDEVVSWDPIVEALAAQAPVWEPGTAHGYHPTTWGWLVGEVLRRVSGRTVGTFLQEQVSRPLDLSLWIGLPPDEAHRVAPVIDRPGPGAGTDTDGLHIDAVAEPGSLLARAAVAPSGAFRELDVWNRPEVLAAEIPASNGVTDARSLARLYAALVGPLADGTPRLLSPEQLTAACAYQSHGTDRVLDAPTRYGLGFGLSPSMSHDGSATAFGHGGFGGSLGFGDRDAHIGFGYVMNRVKLALGTDDRAGRLVASVYTALDRPIPDLGT